MDLSSKIYSQLKPEDAIGIPLAEVDQSVIEDTYCVITKSWGQTYIHRYSRLPTLYLFNPYCSIRRAVIACTTHMCYDLCLIIVVFTNLIDLAIPDSLPLLFERITIIFYIAEALYQIIGRGFIFGSYAYLKNPWMCLDFIITLVSLPDLELDTNASFGIQSLRGIRVLQLITKIPGVKIMSEAIIFSMFRMYGVAMIMCLFLFSVTLTAKQLFMGLFRQKCVKNILSNFSSLNISYTDFINDKSNWAIDSHNDYLMCGNITGAQKCNVNYTCLMTESDSWIDITSFDTFILSLLNSFRLLTQDEWENIYDQIIEGVGPLGFLFFLPVILLGSFFLLNLMLVVVTTTFDFTMSTKNKNMALHSFKYHMSFDFDINELSLYPLPTFRKELQRVLRERDEIKVHNLCIQRTWERIVNLIALKLMVNETNRIHDNVNSMGKWMKFRENVRKISESKVFHYFILLTIIFNTVLLASEHARMSIEFQLVLKYCNVVVTAIFSFEILVYLLANGKKYFFNWWNILDFLIVLQSIASVIFQYVAEYSIFRSLRLLELMKVQQTWPTLQRVISIVLSSVRNIIKLLFVMILLMFTCAVIGNRILGPLLTEHLETSRRSFKTFGGSLFTVFEIFAGEWYENLIACMESSKLSFSCPLIIIPYYLIGFLVIVNVFTAVLLGAFDASTLKLPKLRKKTVPYLTYMNALTREFEGNSTNYKKFLWYLKRFILSSNFELIIIGLIIGSCIIMVFEDTDLHIYPMRKKIIQAINVAFTILFIIEMFLRWFAVGIEYYFSEGWMRFDFIQIMLSLLELFILNTFVISDAASDAMKSLRALRPLRLIPRLKSLALVFQSLVLSLPAMFHAILVVLFIWLPFAILGVHFFAGKFFQCYNEHHEPVEEVIYNKTDCITKGYRWEEMFYNFNHIGSSYLSLFQLAMFTGWTDLVEMMVDFNEEDLQPIKNNHPEFYVFVVIFVFLGAFFSLNLFVGVAVDTFKCSQKHVAIGTMDILLTDTQKKYYNTLLMLGKRGPVIRTDRPFNKFLNYFYTVTYSIWFRTFIFALIWLNSITIALDSYDDPPKRKIILHYCDFFFTVVYTLEFVIKILGLRKYYFNDFWNIFDFLLLSLHVIGDVVLNHPAEESNPLSFLYAFRLLRILRLLRLTDMLVDLRRLLHSTVASIPALLNITMLLFLIIFVYSILGMSLFGHLSYYGIISEKINFQNFINSYLLLFRLTTAQGWEELLESMSLQPPYCDKNAGNCGNIIIAVFFLLSFILISNIILVNIFIAVILENYTAAIMQDNNIINEDNLVQFYKLWKEFDPKATQFIAYEQLPDFLDQLNKDMRIPKPNDIAIVHMNLPLAHGEKVHCLNILMGILEIKAGDVEDSATFRILCDQVQKKFNKMFPKLKTTKFVESTMQLKRKERAARLLQAKLKKMREKKT